ncbi:MAG: CinA family protein [Lachnospiraceae bacterium]|nr:CinA family protein [Lachnospiraceae bacterium]
MTQDEVIKELIRKKQTIALMESCTGGLLASAVTDTEGASEIFFGGEVTYSNEAKIKAGVPQDVIETYGVYSRECAAAMAQAVQTSFRTDIAIGITGTTGNTDPNNPGGSIGEAFFCIRIGDVSHDHKITCDPFGMTRHEIKAYYVREVFEKLKESIS